LCAVLYMLLATGMFFFQDTYFSIGGMELSLKNPCALAILFLALLNLTVTVRLDRLLILSRHTAVQMLPCLVPLVFSSVVWVGTQAESDAVLNGVTMVIPQLLAVLEAAAALYLFGARGIWYCLGAMCAANLAGVLAVIYEGGLGAFLKEFCTLLITFSKETGPLMERLETHDLTFAFGPFLIYLLLHWKKSPHPGLWLGLSAIFFLIGLKRIAIPAVALLFGNVTPYYEISFTYMGRGTGFERFVEWFTGVESSVPLRTQTQIHNDFLRMYLNIGLIGYWVWLWSWLMVRPLMEYYPRARYGEHVDDHQLELTEQLHKMNLVYACRDTEDLPEALRAVRDQSPARFSSNTEAFLRALDRDICAL